MSKGNAPEPLEHRIMSLSRYSTRSIEVSKGMTNMYRTYAFYLVKKLKNQKFVLLLRKS